MIKTKKKSGIGNAAASAADKLKRAKELLGKLKQRGEGGGGNYLRLEDGKNVIRVLPVVTTQGDFFFETRTHFRAGPNEDQTCKCPTAVNKKCAICKAAKAEKDKKAAKKLWPKTQYAMIVLQVYPTKDLKNPKILEVGTKVFKGILGYYTDADEYGNIMELDGGRDIVVTKSGKGMNTDYEVSLRETDKSIVVSDKLMDRVNEKGPDLDKAYDESVYPSYAKTEAILEGVEMEDEGEEEEDVEEETRKKKTKKKEHKARFNKDEEEEEESEEEEEDEESEEEEEDEKPAIKKGKASKKDDDEDEEDEDEEDDEDDSDDESEEESEEDEDEEEEEEEEEESRASSIKKRLKSKARK